MMYLYLLSMFVTTLTVTRADYRCVCNYQSSMPVYREPSKQSEVVGTLYDNDCIPTYGNNKMNNSSNLWVAVQYQKQVMYVAADYHRNIQQCPGNIPIMYKVPTSRTFKPSSRSTASRSTKLTSAVTRICPTSQASYSDYECLCNNHNETAVYPLPSTSGGKIGYMHEFACKPTYQMVKTSPGWQAIQYQKQVGYVFMDGDIYISLCHGRPSVVDVVPNRVPSNKATIRVRFPTSSMSPFKLPSTAASSTSRSTLIPRSKPTVKSSTSPVTEVSYQMTSTEVSRTTAPTSIKPSSDLSTTTSSTPSEVSRTTAHTSPTPTYSSPTTSKLIRSGTVSATDVDVFRQNTSSFLRADTGASTVSSSVEQSPKKCLNNPQQLSDGFGKGTVVGMVLVAFLVGILGGALAVSGFFKLRARAARKYEVLFKNGSADPKTVLQVK